MIQQGVGYTFINSGGGSSLQIDPAIFVRSNKPFDVWEDSTDQGAPILRVNAGTFNNTFPTVNGNQIGEANAYFPAPSGDSIMYLEIPASETTGALFPSGTVTVKLVAGSSVPEYTKTKACVAIAKVKVTPIPNSSAKTYAISQLVTGSLWGERYECGSQLDYWFSQI